MSAEEKEQKFSIAGREDVSAWGSALVRQLTATLVEMRKDNHLEAHANARELEQIAKELAVYIAIAHGKIPL